MLLCAAALEFIWAGRLRIVRQIEAIVPKSCSAMESSPFAKLANTGKNDVSELLNLRGEKGCLHPQNPRLYQRI